MDTIAIKRAKRLRRRILELLDQAKVEGLRGRFLADLLETLPDSLEGDAELAGLCQDLVNLQLATVEDTRTLKTQRAGIDWLVYKITAKGTALLAGGVPVEPLVEDERIS